MYANIYVMIMLWNVENSLWVSGQPFEFYSLQGQQDWQKTVQCFQSYNSYMRSLTVGQSTKLNGVWK